MDASGLQGRENRHRDRAGSAQVLWQETVLMEK